MVPYILVLLSGAIWGITFSLARIATSAGAHPIGLSFWQAAGGGLVMLVYCLCRRRLPAFDRASWQRSVVIALLGTAVPATLYFYAAPRVPAGVLAITVTLVPMLTYLMSLVLRIDRYRPGRMLGILLGFVGILLLVLPDTSLPEPAMVNWLLLAMAASIFYTLENIYVDTRVPAGADMPGMLTLALLLAAVTLLPVIHALDAFVPIVLPLDRVDLSIIGMMVVSALAYLMFLYAVKLAGAVFASLTAYVVTLSGVLWGMFFFAEQHSAWVWGSLALLLAGITLVTPREESPATRD